MSVVATDFRSFASPVPQPLHSTCQKFRENLSLCSPFAAKRPDLSHFAKGLGSEGVSMLFRV